MDAIILAGGKGTRMQPLTFATPKPLLEVQGRPILEWSLMSLSPVVDHVIVVVNYLQDQIAAYMAQQTLIPHYELVEQMPSPQGTGHAVQCCKPYLTSTGFVVINGDDLYDTASLTRLSQEPVGILGARRDDAPKWGVLVTEDQLTLHHIHEKPPAGMYEEPVLVNAGAYKLDTRVFQYELPLSPRMEYEITDYVTYLANIGSVSIVPGQFWFPIGTPQDLEQAQALDLNIWL